MRIGLALIAALADGQGFDPVRQCGRRDIAQVLQELLEPEFEIEAVPEDQVGILCRDDVLGRGFIAVDLCPWLCDGNDRGMRPRHVLNHVGQNGECRHDLEFFCRKGRSPADECGKGKAQMQASHGTPLRYGWL